MSFRRLLYFNRDRVIEYNAIISSEDFAEFEEIEVIDASVFGGDAKLVKGEKQFQHNKKGKIFSAYTRMWNTFLSNLQGSDFFIDCIDTEKSMSSIGRDIIVRIETVIGIPDEFDTFSIINSLPPTFIGEQLLREIEQGDKDLVRSFFKIKKASMPVTMNVDGKTLCAKLRQDDFVCNEEEFEEALEEDLVVVAKVIAPNRSKEREIFNPLKDFLVMNRATRRSMNVQDEDGLKNIYVDSDYMYVEVLAIYQ